MTRLADAVYRMLLRVFPAETRRQHGEEFLRQYRSQRALAAGGWLSAVALWCRLAGDAVWHGVLERLPVQPSVRRQSWSEAMDHLHARAGGEATGSARRWGSGITQDVRQAARRLVAKPGFALIAIVTLALGIGANSAIFSVVHSVLFEPLPFPNASRLVGLYQVWEGKRDVFSGPNFIDVQKRATTLEASAAYDTHRAVLTNAGDPETLVAIQVTAGFFDTLRVPPLAGRALVREDNDPGRAGVVVLSHALWRERFGGDPSMLSRTITLDAKPYRVVGIMPPGFAWPLQAQLWVPIEYTDAFVTKDRASWYLDAIGRLKPGVSVAQAAAELESLARQLERESPLNAKVGETVYPLLDALVGDTRRALLVLLAAVGLVLLIACANVANLTLARASSRGEELAVRTALGASRWQLVRQLLIESLLLATLGGGAGLGCAALGVRGLLALRPAGIPRLDHVGVDASVLWFTLGATLATGLLFGLLPALTVTGRSLSGQLRERGRSGTASRGSRRVRGLLVVSEMALAMMLLAGAGLLVRSFVRLSRVDPGFTVGHAAVFNVGLPDVRYKEDATRLDFFSRLHDRLAHLPGVTAVGAVLAVPPTSLNFNLSFTVTGWPALAPADQPGMEIRIADEHYFQTMGIPIKRGRGFTAEDRAGNPPVVLLTESGAARFLAADEPIGKHIVLGWRRDGHVVGGDIVGIVADVKSFGLDQAPPPQLYLPLAQAPLTSMAFVVRTAGDERALFSAIRQTTSSVDRDVPVNRLETLEEHVSESIAERRFYMLLLTIFAAIALTLSAVGIFGVLSYLVAQRTREIGIRVALGAQRTSVVGMIVRQALGFAAAGVALGTAGALSLSHVMQALLFDLQSTDPATFVLVAAGLVGVALAAAYVPARRAIRVDPILTLRAD